MKSCYEHQYFILVHSKRMDSTVKISKPTFTELVNCCNYVLCATAGGG